MMGDARIFKYFNADILEKPEVAFPFVGTLESTTLEAIKNVEEKLTYWDRSALNAKETDLKLFKRFGWKTMNGKQIRRMKKQSASDPFFFIMTSWLHTQYHQT